MYVILIEEYFDDREYSEWSTIEDYYFESLESAEKYLTNLNYYKEEFETVNFENGETYTDYHFSNKNEDDLFYCYAYIKKLELKI